ncbi:uncharacterized protein LOC108737613 [Agrilus planipennis]|uniref:Uncharacterized protein LOC108737613 n=1 Tax=Agrilus planipennis TaxID=224129 RepID=A0A1W4X160_AGRPL|nr:uncharacterized protein LOC108737613 [Agrilus planipennis]
MIRQVVHVLFLATVLQCAIAVINSSTSKATDDATDNTKTAAINKIADSVSASTEQNGNRREAADHSGPQLIEETYLVLPNNKPNLPVPVYGVPSAVKYPGPPPDIPPSPSIVPTSYRAPPSGSYGPPIPNFNKLPPPIYQHYGPPVRQVFLSLPQKNYGPPPSKPVNVFLKAPTPLYGAPFPARPFPQKPLISTYKVPKPVYGVPPKYSKIPKPLYGPPTGPLNTYGPPATYIGVPIGITPPGKGSFESPKDSYGVPVKNVHLPLHTPKQLPPQLPLGPPGIPAPPTPPDIKYDGWQPIPGLVSKPPSAYGAPNVPKHSSLDLNINSDFVPPPLEVEDHKHNGQGFRDSYSAPLNSVTGSGGVVSSSGLALKPEPGDDITLSLGLSSLGIQSGRESLSVIKSIDYDLSQFGNLLNVQLPLPGSSGGLIPPSGVYGAPPAGHYGIPLLNSQKTQVPLGLIQTIGKNVGFNDGYHSQGNQQYLSPPVADQKYHGVPSSFYNPPLENKPIPFESSGAGGGGYLPPATISDSYGTPQYSELTSSYSNIPVSYDLTSSVPGHIPISHNSNGAHIGSDENCDTEAQINLEVPLSSGSGYSGNEETAADLEVALSQKSKSVSVDPNNEVAGKSSLGSKETDEDAHAVSIAKSLHPNSELIKSRDIDLNNIPLKGSRGTYTLSIQSSDGSGSLKSLPPDQILNEGILQSILNAIEQPQYSGIGAIQQTYPQQTISYLRKNEINNKHKFLEEGKLSHFKDSDSQGSVNTQVVLEAPASNNTSGSSVNQPVTTPVAPLQFLDNNEIAFYFRNNAEMHNDVSKDNNNSPAKQNKSNEAYSFENKNQYESYVSYKTRNADISYGNIGSSNSTIGGKSLQ